MFSSTRPTMTAPPLGWSGTNAYTYWCTCSSLEAHNMANFRRGRGLCVHHWISSIVVSKSWKNPQEPVHKRWGPADQYSSLQKYTFYFGRRTPDTLHLVWYDGMTNIGMWYDCPNSHGMGWPNMVLEMLKNGMTFSSHDTMECGMVPHTMLEWVPSRYLKSRNWYTS